MAEANFSLEPVVEVPLDLDVLATQSDLYKALVDFHGTDAIDVLTYPIGSPFTKQCFLTVIQNLGSKEEFSNIYNLFPIGELFRVALYLGSDTLLYYLVFDTLNTGTAVTLLELAIDTLGMDHYITDTIVQFINIITHHSRAEIVKLMRENKIALRRRIKNNVRKSGNYILRTIQRPIIATEFMNPNKMPEVCLCCKLPITGYNTKTLRDRLVPMGCCGMMVHLECQVKFLKRTGLPNCPACQTTYQHGLIDPEYRDLGSILTIHSLNNWHVIPLPYRIRNLVWPSRSANDIARHGTYHSTNTRPG